MSTLVASSKTFTLAILLAANSMVYATDAEDLRKESNPSTFLMSGNCADIRRNFEPGPRSQSDLTSISRSAESGNPYCQVLLGNWYEYGKGVEIDYKKARLLYSSASSKLNSGTISLGKMAELGHGMPVSYSEAFSLYTKAAQSEEPSAFSALANLYENGFFVNQDHQLAAQLYQKAVLRGDFDAWKKLEKIETQQPTLSQDQILELREKWRQRLAIAVPGAIRMAMRRVNLNNPTSLELVIFLSYRRNENFPTIAINSSSGNEVVDNAIEKNLGNYLLMPSPPIFEKSTEIYQIKLPIKYEAVR